MSNIYLAEIVNLHEPSTSDGYPFNIPAIKSLRSLSFTTDVTYFIGENGRGKSTLLEAIAIKMGMNAEGGGRNFNFSTNATHSNLEEELKCVRTPYRLYDNFFYRAESFYNALPISRASKVGETHFLPMAAKAFIIVVMAKEWFA